VVEKVKVGAEMNALSQEFELTVEGRQIEEAVASVFHTLLLHRAIGKFHYKEEGSYQVGTLGTEDVDCDYIDLTYVRLSSDELTNCLRREVVSFRDALRQQDGQRNGQIQLEFFEKRRRNWFGDEAVPWEIWILKLDVVRLNNESEHQRLRESVGDALSDIIFSICRNVNANQYLPKMPVQSELTNVFDSRFSDVQPYLHKIQYKVNGPATGTTSISSTVQKLIRGTLSL